MIADRALIRQIEKLRREHTIEAFDCGHAELKRFLQQHALQNQGNGRAQTYVGLVDSTVVGYCALAVGSAEQEAAPERVKKGLAKHAIPIMLPARLALNRHWQTRGVGAALLKDTVLRTLQAAGMAGIRALVVHAKDDTAIGFYQPFDFIPSPTDPLYLFVLLKGLRQLSF